MGAKSVLDLQPRSLDRRFAAGQPLHAKNVMSCRPIVLRMAVR